MLLLTTSQACMAEISLTTDTTLASEGYFVLSWESDSDSALTLQQAVTENFTGPNEIEVSNAGSMTITGLVDGKYFYRVLDGAEQSNTLVIEVAHHSLTRAFTFFFLGLLLFFILLTSIYIGHIRREGE